MAISFVGSASAASNTVAMPAHQAGDMIVTYIYNGVDTTAPTATGVDSNAVWGTSGTSCAARIVYNIADTNSEVTGVWTNTTYIAVMVYRKSSTDTWTAPVIYTSNGVGATITYSESSYFGPYFRQRWNNTESWMLRFAGHSSASNLAATTPSGWTARAGVGGGRSMDSGGVIANKSSTSIGDNTQAVNASGNWITITMQIEVWNGKGVVCMSAHTVISDTASVHLLPSPGDLILVSAGRSGNNTPPTLPADYTLLASGGANNLSNLVCYKIATGNESATFTNANTISFVVYRAANGIFDVVDVGAVTNGNDTVMNWSGAAVDPVSHADTKFVRFGVFNGTGFPAFPDGWPVKTVRTSVAPANWMSDADGLVAVDDIGTNTITFGSTIPWRATTIRIASKHAPSVENTNVSNAPVPDGVAGCYVSLIGGGGGGGGTNKPNSGGWGAGGGGGGGVVRRVFVPVSSLGSTYSVASGAGGGGGGTAPAAGGNGGDSTFTSGAVSIVAGGGAGGFAGGSGTSAGGAGGTYSGIGSFTYDGVGNGASGGNGSRTNGSAGSTGGTDSIGAPGGGGGGADGGSASAGGAGGAGDVSGGSAGGSGGGAGGSPANAPIGLRGGGGGGGGGNAGFGSTGGAGGTGSAAGAGGGGAGGKQGFLGNGNSGGGGGAGYTLVEWVAERPNPGQFFRASDVF